MGGLPAALRRYSCLSKDERRAMSGNSYNLSLQYTTARWVSYFRKRVTEAETGDASYPYRL